MKSLLLIMLALTPLTALAAPISIRVIDEAGAAIEGATVQVNRYDDVENLYLVGATDARGVAEFEVEAATPNGEFFGYAAAWKADRALSWGRLFKLQDHTLTLTMKAAAPLEGIVEDAKGPVEGALVAIENLRIDKNYMWLGADSPLAQKLAARSDANGNFRLQGVPADARLRLRVTNEKYATHRVSVEAGTLIQVVLQPGATLRGQVLDVAGAPLAGLKVFAAPRPERDNDNTTDTTTDADGNYALTGLSSGAYNVLFRPTKNAEFVVAARENALAVAGVERELETARAVAGIVVRGRVVDAVTRAGIDGIVVRVFGPTQPETSEAIAAVTTDKDGNFSARIARGANALAAINTPWGWKEGANRVEIAARADGAAPDVVIELTPVVPLRGRIVDENGAGVKTQLSVGLTQDRDRGRNQHFFDSDESGDFTIYPDFKGEATIGESIYPQDEESALIWEVAEAPTFELPRLEPLQIVVRRAPVSALKGRALDENGAPLEGVKLNLGFAQPQEPRSIIQHETVVSDAQGNFDFPRVRAGYLVSLRGIEKSGYELQSGGEIAREGENWRVQTVVMHARQHQLAGRIVRADGTAAAGALVFAVGAETRADEKGAYILKVLPAGNVDVFAYAQGEFGFLSAPTALPADAATPTELKISPQTLQGQDRELAGEMLARARVLAVQTNSDDIGSLKLEDADAVAALEKLIAAPPRKAEEIAFAVYQSATNSDVTTELLLRAVRAVPDVNWRLAAATMLFARRPDWPNDAATRELVAALARNADAATAQKSPDKSMGVFSLVGLAPLIERFEGEAAGRAALQRGIDFAKTQFPAPDDDENSASSILAAGAEIVAANSPGLYAQLLQAIEPASSDYARALHEGSVAIARARGLEAAAPFLRQLGEIVQPTTNEDGDPMRIPYPVTVATRRSIAAGGEKAPDLALQLARALAPENDGENENMRALAEAAFFQSSGVAATLWKQTLPQLRSEYAANIAARVGQKQPELGAELMNLARGQLEAEMRDNRWGQGVVAPFAFYEARLDAARARYRLEKAWQEAQGKSDDWRTRPDLARVMASIDGERAFEWASQLPVGDAENDERINVLSQAARYLAADAGARQRADLEQWMRGGSGFNN